MFEKTKVAVLLALCVMAAGTAQAYVVDEDDSKIGYRGSFTTVTITFWSNGDEVFVGDDGIPTVAGGPPQGGLVSLPSSSNAEWVRSTSDWYAIALGNPNNILMNWNPYITSCCVELNVWFAADGVLGNGSAAAGVYWNGESLAEHYEDWKFGEIPTDKPLLDAEYGLYFFGLDLKCHDENWLSFHVTNGSDPTSLMFYGQLTYTYVGDSVPEPLSMSLLAFGATGLLIRRKR